MSSLPPPPPLPSTLPAPPPEPDPEHVCSGCGNVCQSDVCWCGDTRSTHESWYQGHPFVPYGCTCLMHPRTPRPEAAR